MFVGCVQNTDHVLRRIRRMVRCKGNVELKIGAPGVVDSRIHFAILWKESWNSSHKTQSYWYDHGSNNYISCCNVRLLLYMSLWICEIKIRKCIFTPIVQKTKTSHVVSNIMQNASRHSHRQVQAAAHPPSGSVCLWDSAWAAPHPRCGTCVNCGKYHRRIRLAQITTAIKQINVENGIGKRICLRTWVELLPELTLCWSRRSRMSPEQ